MNQSDPEILGPEQAQQLIKELRARQVEIETQNAELRGRLRALEATGPQPARALCEPDAQGPDSMARSQTEIALRENEKNNSGPWWKHFHWLSTKPSESSSDPNTSTRR